MQMVAGCFEADAADGTLIQPRQRTAVCQVCAHNLQRLASHAGWRIERLLAAVRGLRQLVYDRGPLRAAWLDAKSVGL
jgi:hypothetical protein